MDGDELPMLIVDQALPAAPAGKADRFGGRWRLVEAGLSDVWRYGDLVMQAGSGRLLLRGPNGTGKTTALEALWPYLLDLNALKLNAGKARTTSLRSLMREGAAGKRRFGYAWLTLHGPGSDGEWSYGVRLQYSESTPVRVVPFVVPGRPLRDLALHGDGRASLSLEDFTAAVEEAGGQVFDDADEYVGNLAARVWSATAQDMKELAARLRVLRNPTLLGDLTPAAAAEALRDALPTVNGEVVEATAEALAESDATRGAFTRDEAAAEVLDEFAEVWAGHVVAVVNELHRAAVDARAEVGRAERKHRGLVGDAKGARRDEREVREIADGVKESLRDTRAEHKALLESQDYQDARGLDALRQAQEATAKTRDSVVRALWQEGRNATARAGRLLADLGLLREDIDRIVAGVVAKEPGSAPAGSLLTWTTRPRAIISVGDVVVDPGPDVSVTIDLDALRAQAQDWTDVAAARRARASDAHLALTDHAHTVAPAEKELATLVQRVSETRAAADRIQQAHQRAEVAAREDAGRLLGRLRRWVASPVGLTLAAPSLPDRAGPAFPNEVDDQELRPDGDWAVTGWSVTDVEELAGAEVSQIVVQVDEWRQLVQSHAVSEVARQRTRAGRVRTAGLELAAEARSCRAEANELRGGKLLALPRPGWINGVAARRTADPVAEELLLGSMVGWRDEVSDETERALIESALSASGVLGAKVTPEGADGGDWFVTAAGDDPAANQVTLASVLQVNESGQQAEVASAVLGRIPLAQSAGSGSTGLTIGRDGSFAAGPLRGWAPGSLPGDELPPAAHIGARQRREAALARAVQLDSQAAELEDKAALLALEANGYDEQADTVETAVRDFPPTVEAQRAESFRALLATQLSEALTEVSSALEARAVAEEVVRDQRDSWIERTRARQLPVSIDDIQAALVAASDSAAALADGAMGLMRVLPRVGHLDIPPESATGRGTVTLSADDLARLVDEARQAHEDAESKRVEYETRVANVGAAAQEVLRRIGELDRLVGELERKSAEAEKVAVAAGNEAVRLETEAGQAEHAVQAAQPAADEAVRRLETVLRADGVAGALSDRGTAGTASPEEGSPWWGDDPVDATGVLLKGRRPTVRRTLRERYDQARAALAGTWTLDPADGVGELDTYVLMHDDLSYTPPQAAKRGQQLKERARAALDAAEEGALRDFVIGRLPAAIGVAWTRMHDWADEVNRKMRSAAASSGVGVQVRLRLRTDLSPAERTAYELSCQVSDADRTREQKADIGEALTQLIGAADGDSMVERIGAAVDVRSWVTIHYEVDRGTGKIERWGSRTALSGGERRLVVLAPMLAAVAAGYDSLGAQGLRIAALDEVPAEVDERGREGLARYLAELDLDLIATSYLWDGAPGAWDGIDAWDLEAGSDGTVVAFPMMIRGLLEFADGGMVGQADDD